MGVTVAAGMTTATLFGIFIIPMLFIIVETFKMLKIKGDDTASDQDKD